MHSRRTPVRYSFVYSVFMLLVDLDELPGLNRRVGFFSYNRPNLVSILDRDHLPDPAGHSGQGSIKDMVLLHLAQHGISLEGGKVYMLTNPRILGYVFNPITVYYCYSAQGELVADIAEVGNTFGELYPYVLGAHNALPLTAEGGAPGVRRYQAEKVFYVSPFISMDGCYQLSLSAVQEKMIVHVDEFRQGEKFFTATLWGETRPLTAPALAACLLRYPFMTLKVIGAIHWEGLKLYLKKVRFIRRKHVKYVKLR